MNNLTFWENLEQNRNAVMRVRRGYDDFNRLLFERVYWETPVARLKIFPVKKKWYVMTGRFAIATSEHYVTNIRLQANGVNAGTINCLPVRVLVSGDEQGRALVIHRSILISNFSSGNRQTLTNPRLA